MTAEELNMIRNDPDRWGYEDIVALCAEVERLQEQLQSLPLTGDWLSDLANKCAYQIHRVIGNNIEHYRGQTAKELQSFIRTAIARNS